MNTLNALQLCLVLHLTGLVLMAGMSVADFVRYNSFWKQYTIDYQQGLALLNANAVYQRLLAIGAGLLLVTGVCMMALTRGVFGEQLWMRIKIGIVVLLIINGPILGRRQGLKLKRLLAEKGQQARYDSQLATVRRRLRQLAIVNFIFLITIVVLSVFKFN